MIVVTETDRMRAVSGLIIACHRIARLKLSARRAETGREFDAHTIALFAENEMREIMAKVDRAIAEGEGC